MREPMLPRQLIFIPVFRYTAAAKPRPCAGTRAPSGSPTPRLPSRPPCVMPDRSPRCEAIDRRGFDEGHALRART